MQLKSIIVVTAATLALAAVTAPVASAADVYVPSQRVCSPGSKPSSACLKVSDAKVSAGQNVTFTGHLFAKARKNLAQWTKGDNTVCLTRYETKPLPDGGWPSTTLDGACSAVRKDGGFSITVGLNRKGTFYYGVEMGPCQGSAGLCGNGDPGLVGVGSNKGNKVLAVTTN